MPDIYTTDCFRQRRCGGRQSDREPVYREAVERLQRQGLVYACDCSRRQVEEDLNRSGSVPAIELRYSGRCRQKGLPLGDGTGWRVRMDPGVETFVDERLGAQAQSPAEQCGDMLIRDRLGNWTYQFAVVVDDWRQHITDVIRGVDLLPSTGRQILLARLLGRDAPPRFLHHALIMKSADQKLSKSDRDTGVRDLRARGWSPEDVRDAARRFLTGSAPS